MASNMYTETEYWECSSICEGTAVDTRQKYGLRYNVPEWVLLFQYYIIQYLSVVLLFQYYVIPYLSVVLLFLLVYYLPVGLIPYPVIWLYDKLLWLTDPLLLVLEVVLALNFIMHCSRRCAENIEEDEEEAWKWKLLLSVFSALCYALLSVLVVKMYQEASNLQFWMLLLVLAFSMMLAAHNMMWMSHEGIVSDVAFVTLCSMVAIYAMMEEAQFMHKPLAKPSSWYSSYQTGSLLRVSVDIIHTPLDNAKLAISYLKRFLSPMFMIFLGIRLYSILFLIQRVIRNFGLEKDELELEDVESYVSPWRSPVMVKCSIIFMITQSTARLFYQSSGVSMQPSWWTSIINQVWPQDLLFGRMLQIVVVNVFYIWRLYCADDWQWSDWFSA